MKFPTLSTCDLFNQQQYRQKVVVHKLSELFENDIYVPKKPHRHTFYQIIYIQEGKGIHKIDFVDYQFTNQTIFFIAPGQVHDLRFLEINSKGLIINFSEDLFQTFLANDDFIDNFWFFHKSGQFSTIELKENLHIIQKIFNQILSEKRENILRLHLLHLMYECNESILNKLNKIDLSAPAHQLKKFEELVEQNYETEHYPKFYADQLSISPNYLNALCKKERNKTAGVIIRERILLEAKRLLVNSTLDISEISFLLGFEDNSYFTKFFKSQTQLTPKQFRSQL